MSLKAKVDLVIDARTKKIAETILYELRAECPKQSGRSARSFHIEKNGRNYRIVSSKLSAYYADQGNGGPGRTIYPRRAKALKITNGVNKTLGYARYVHGYYHEGEQGFVKRVAERHGG